MEYKFDKLQLTRKNSKSYFKKDVINWIIVASEKATATPEQNYIASPASEAQSHSTKASTNQKTEGEMVMIVSEDEEEILQGKLASSSKGPRSKERKLSNENCQMLPPRAKEGVILRPCSKFASMSTIKPNKPKTDQQPLKPMTILGFLQKSVDGKLLGGLKRRVEKADFKSLEALSLSSSTGKTEASVPSFTLG